MWHLGGRCLVFTGLINIPQYASWRWTPCQRCSPFYPQSCLSMKFFSSSKCNQLSVTVPSCPEVFIVWRCTPALPVSSQMFHCGQSICHCQRWQAVVTMVTVLGLNCWRCRSPQGTTDLTTRICRALCTFFARSVSVLWQMSKKYVTSPQPNLSTAMHAGYNFHLYSTIKNLSFTIWVTSFPKWTLLSCFCAALPRDLWNYERGCVTFYLTLLMKFDR